MSSAGNFEVAATMKRIKKMLEECCFSNRQPNNWCEKRRLSLFQGKFDKVNQETSSLPVQAFCIIPMEVKHKYILSTYNHLVCSSPIWEGFGLLGQRGLLLREMYSSFQKQPQIQLIASVVSFLLNANM